MSKCELGTLIAVVFYSFCAVAHKGPSLPKHYLLLKISYELNQFEIQQVINTFCSKNI